VKIQKMLAKLRLGFQETFNYKGDSTDWFELKEITWQ